MEVMKIQSITGMLVLLALACICRASTSIETPFSRYQVILDRKPFGEMLGRAPAVAPPVKPTPEPPPFVKSLRMCAVTEGNAGVRVGFVNIANKKDTKSYFLYLGETSDDGITVVDADFEKEGAKLSKDGQEFWIYMGGAPAPGDNEASSTVAAVAASPGSPGIAGKPNAESMRASYADRLRQRREALRVRTTEPPRLEGKDLEEHLQKYQMDLIRKGMPPLPMRLTQEMDDQLVKEGVLPAAENTP